MSQTKIEIFKVGISQNSVYDFDKVVIEQINNFLKDDNKIYINHSTSILTEDINEYGISKTINKYLIITIVYKDLNETQYNLKNLNSKVKSIVKKEFEKGETLPEPIIETELDKKIKQLKTIKDTNNDIIISRK